MNYYYFCIFLFIGVFIIHTCLSYPERFLIYPSIEKVNKDNKKYCQVTSDNKKYCQVN